MNIILLDIKGVNDKIGLDKVGQVIIHDTKNCNCVGELINGIYISTFFGLHALCIHLILLCRICAAKNIESNQDTWWVSLDIWNLWRW